MKSIKKRNNMKNINNINKINKLNKLNKLMAIILIIFIILFSNTYFLKIYGNEDLENGNSNEVKVEENKDNKNNNDNNKEENTNKTEEKNNTQETSKAENTLNLNSATEEEKTDNKTNKTNTTNTTKNNKTTSTGTSKSSNTNNKTNTYKSTVNKTTDKNISTNVNANTDQTNVNEISEENNNTIEEKQKYILKEIKLSYIDSNNEKQVINFTPEFREDVYNYYCNIDDNISKIDISFNEDNYNDNIGIKGNENIPDGISQILITVKNEETYSKVYIIEVQKGKKLVASKANKRKKVIFSLIGILSVLTVFFIIQAKRYSRTKHMKTRTSKREKRAINRARDRKLNAMINKLKIEDDE